MTSLFRSFMDAVIPPPPHKAPESPRPWAASISGGPWPKESRPEETRESQQASSRTDLEQGRVTNDPNILGDQQVEVEDLGSDSEEDEQEQRNPLDPGDLASQITVRRPRPILTPAIPPQEESNLEYSERKHLKAAFKWGIYLRMPSFTRMSPLSCRLPMIHWKVGSLNRHIWWRRPLELYTLQSLRHPRGSESCSSYKGIVKPTSKGLLAKQSLSIKSSSQLLSRNSSRRTISTNRWSIDYKTRCMP